MTDRDYLESQGLWIIGISHQPLPRSEAERMATAEVAEWLKVHTNEGEDGSND